MSWLKCTDLFKLLILVIIILVSNGAQRWSCHRMLHTYWLSVSICSSCILLLNILLLLLNGHLLVGLLTIILSLRQHSWVLLCCLMWDLLIIWMKPRSVCSLVHLLRSTSLIVTLLSYYWHLMARTYLLLPIHWIILVGRIHGWYLGMVRQIMGVYLPWIRIVSHLRLLLLVHYLVGHLNLTNVHHLASNFLLQIVLFAQNLFQLLDIVLNMVLHPVDIFRVYAWAYTWRVASIRRAFFLTVTSSPKHWLRFIVFILFQCVRKLWKPVVHFVAQAIILLKMGTIVDSLLIRLSLCWEIGADRICLF